MGKFKIRRFIYSWHKINFAPQPLAKPEVVDSLGRSKSEREPSSQSTARQCLPRTGAAIPHRSARPPNLRQIGHRTDPGCQSAYLLRKARESILPKGGSFGRMENVWKDLTKNKWEGLKTKSRAGWRNMKKPSTPHLIFEPGKKARTRYCQAKK